MRHEDFVHLHLHSEYSLLDGAIRINPLLKQAEKFKMPAVAVTDHGNLFAAMEFYGKGYKTPVKPIIGSEVYVAPKSRFDRGAQLGRGEDYSHHLVLLVKNKKGYKNLCKLVSAGYLEGFYYKPRIDKELLGKHSEGLIALSACLKGEVARKLTMKKRGEAEAAVRFYKELFGDRYYLEVMDHGLPEQKAVNPQIVELAKKYDVKLVATNDCHYLAKSHAHAHDALLCIQTGKTLSMTDRMRFSSNEFYFKSAQEMRTLFSEIPSAVTNTLEVAERCNLDLRFGEYHLPDFDVQKSSYRYGSASPGMTMAQSGFRVPSDMTPHQYLEALVEHNLAIRLMEAEKRGEPIAQEEQKIYKKRVEYELDVIDKMKFAGYFLIVWDFVLFAKMQKIPVGPGRGSAAGSLVAYCLGITDIDPLKYDLLFERFLNPDRSSMPDIDIDFCMERRGEVIKYVQEKYGEKNVAQIITFGTMKARGVIRDVGRVMDLNYSEVDTIAKLVPDNLGITIEEAVKTEKRLAEMEKKDTKIAELLKTGRLLEGMARHASTHAAGVVISPSELTNFLPLYRPSKSDEVVTQYTMNDIDKLGLLKMDFLGLRTLTVIDWTEKQICATKEPEFSTQRIPIDDKKTYQLLASAATLGIFQLESSGMRDILRKMKPEAFTDIIALVALFRPGPIGSGMIDSFIRRKHGTEKIESILPQMNDILKETYGVIVYQEQVMKLANELADFSMAQADALRKAMGKKNPEIMSAQRDTFIKGAVARKIDENKAEKIFSLMEQFGEYGFNKSHSAAYALISYRTAYLKAHYPMEFMASLLTGEMENTDKIVRYLGECREMKIKVTPPDINISNLNFTVAGKAILFGLAAVKGIGGTAAMGIIRARENGCKFKSLLDFAKRVDLRQVNRRVLDALIKCGAFDSLDENRSALFESLDYVLEEAAIAHDEKATGQANMFAQMESENQKLERLIVNAEPWPEQKRLAYEKETLGFFITGHPLARYQKEIKRLATHKTAELSEVAGKQEVRLCGVVSLMKTQLTKKKERFAYVTLEDLSGSARLIVWPDVYRNSARLLESSGPIFARGRMDSSENDTKVIAEELLSLATALEKFTNSIHLKLNLVGLEEPILEQIKNLAEKHRGASTLMLHFTFPDKKKLRVSASERYRVAASESFISEMESVIGANNVYCT